MHRALRARHVPRDCDVVRWVSEDEPRSLTAHQLLETRVFERITAKEKVIAQSPEIATLRDGGVIALRPIYFVRRIKPRLRFRGIQRKIDFRRAEPGHTQVDFDVELGKIPKLNREKISIPTCGFGDPIVGESIGTSFSLAELIEPQDGHSAPAQLPSGSHSAVTGDDLAVDANQNRVCEAEPLYTGGDLINLFFAVSARISSSGFQPIDRPSFNEPVVEQRV
nr:hypothetical protein [Nitrosomonas nitrosa]